MLSFRKQYHGCIIDENFLLLNWNLQRKLKRYIKKYKAYDMELLNNNEILIKVGNNCPFNFDYYRTYKKAFNKFGIVKDVSVLFIPMKVLIKLADTKLNIYIERIR